jgi:predicted Fe-Mo cluster-binding NifX family protein
MKIGVMSTGPTLEHFVGALVKRSGYLLIIDLETMQYLAAQNPVHALSGPAAGRLFAQILVQSSVNAILTGNCDRNIRQTLCKAGVQVVRGKTGIVYKIVESFKRSYQST